MPKRFPKMPTVTSRSHRRSATVAALALALLCATPACQNVPSHRKIMRYHRHEELKAARTMADLRAQYDAGEISDATYDAQSRLIVKAAPEKAMDSLFRDHLLSTRTAAPPAKR